MRDEGDITKTEELKMNHLSVEEVAARRAELRKMRELMFRAEAKAKRVAKIKSKTYRKIQKKSQEKIKSLLKQANGQDDEDDGDEERMKREVERAKERATLRHKNTGKWAKAMKERGELDIDQRREIEEMLERGETLRAKILGDNGSEDEDDEDAEGGVKGIKASAFEELRRLDDDTDFLKEKGKGVFSMKFMQDAMAREAKRVGKAADDFCDEMARAEGSNGEAADTEDAVVEPSNIQMQRMGGRISLRPGQSAVCVVHKLLGPI
jgi:U3 small nucleolar RNA-associated protein 14